MRKLIPILLGACLVPASVAGSEKIAGPVMAEIIRVIDGDTILVEATPWPQQRIEVYVRIRGIDTPEIKSKCPAVRRAAEEARLVLDEMAASSPHVLLTNISGDKYFGRIVADMLFEDGRNPAHEMMTGGFATGYDGGHKPRIDCTSND
jgi:endonuclease YncB( thermonuclease family)